MTDPLKDFIQPDADVQSADADTDTQSDDVDWLPNGRAFHDVTKDIDPDHDETAKSDS